MKMEIDIQGMEEMGRLLRLLGDEGPKELGGAMWREATAIMNASKAIVPVKLSTLKTSGHVQLPKYDATGVSVTLGYGGAASAYAAFVHEGTRPHIIRPRYAKVLHFFVKGQEVFTTIVRHPGTKPTKYLQIPFEAASKGMIERLAGALRAAWQRKV